MSASEHPGVVSHRLFVNARHQRVLNGKTPNQIVAERLKARRKLANAKPHGRTGPDDIAKTRLVVEAAKEVSQPDS